MMFSSSFGIGASAAFIEGFLEAKKMKHLKQQPLDILIQGNGTIENISIWSCSFCKSLNRSNKENCRNCGAPQITLK